MAAIDSVMQTFAHGSGPRQFDPGARSWLRDTYERWLTKHAKEWEAQHAAGFGPLITAVLAAGKFAGYMATDQLAKSMTIQAVYLGYTAGEILRAWGEEPSSFPDIPPAPQVAIPKEAEAEVAEKEPLAGKKVGVKK